MNKLFIFIDELRNNKKISYFFLSISLFSVIYLLSLIKSENIDFAKLLKISTFNIFILIFLFYLCLALSWSALMGGKLFDKKYIVLWFSSVIGKYIPLGIGIPLLRFEKDKYGKNDGSKDILKTTVKEYVLIVLSGLFLLLLLVVELYFQKHNFTLIIVLVIIILYFSLRVFKKTNVNFLNYLVANFLMLIFIAYLTYLQFGQIRIEFIFGYLLSSIISLIAVGVPAGIGIRELSFLQIMSLIGITSGIVEFIAYTRIFLVLFDLILFFGIKVFKQLSS